MAARYLIGAAALSLALSSHAFAQCRSVDADLEDFKTAGGVQHEFLTGDEKRRAVEIFNAIPPATNGSFEIVLMGRFENGIGALATGNNGEICFRVAFPPNEFEALLRAVKGQGI